MKQHPAGSYLANSNPYGRADSEGARRKRFGLLVALLMLAATVTFSGCASQGLADSAGNSGSSTLPSASPFNTPGAAHDVILSWSPSTSSGVVGYNVYRGTVSDGPYVKLNASPIAITSYSDVAVQAGQTYYYVVTATSSTNTESIFSNQVSAAVP